MNSFFATAPRGLSDLLLRELAKPDPRDYMSLPYEPRDWAGLLSPDVKGKKLGLVLDIGAGLKVQPAVSAAVRKAAEAFEAAGAKVEPVGPFITQEMHEGLDRFFQVRLLADVCHSFAEHCVRAGVRRLVVAAGRLVAVASWLVAAEGAVWAEVPPVRCLAGGRPGG